VAKALAEAVARVQAEATKAPNDKALQAVLAKAKELSNQANTDLANAQKMATELTAKVKPATDAHAAAVKKAADVQAEVAMAPKMIEAKTAAVKAAQAKATTDQTALDQANAAVKATSEKVDRLKAALTKS